MKIKISFVYLAVVILIGSLFLAVAKPALMEIAGLPEEGYSLQIDYGIPVKWFRQDTVGVPSGSPLPKNSVGLDFICIESALRTDGIAKDAYLARYRGDPFNRPFRLPPLHLLVYTWVTFFKSVRAIGLWCLATFILTFLNALFWFEWSRRLSRSSCPEISPLTGVLLSGLFAVSYPAIFEFERGQTDTVVLSLVSLCVYLFARRRFFWAGVSLSVAALFKVYPFFILVPLFLAGLFAIAMPPEEKGLQEKKPWVWFLAGQLAAAVAAWGLMFPQHLYYLTKVVLPYARADEMPPESVYYHSLHAGWGGWGLGIWVVVWFVLSAGFIFSIRRGRGFLSVSAPKTALFLFTLLAAWSAFMAKTSYDYNLIMLIPLFALLIAGGLGDAHLFFKLGGVLVLMGFALPRWFQDLVLPNLYPVSAYLVLEVAGLCLVSGSTIYFLIKNQPHEQPSEGH